MTEKHEIIEVQTEKQGFLSKMSHRIENTGTKTLVVLGVAVALLIGGGFLLVDALEDHFDDSREIHHQTSNRVAGMVDDNDDDDLDNTGQATMQGTASSIAVVASSELDGTYTATVYDETYTLTVKGNQGTLQTSEADGEQELESVVFDLDKKVAYVDDDAETYTFDGKTLVLTEVDNDLFDKDQITFTKQ